MSPVKYADLKRSQQIIKLVGAVEKTSTKSIKVTLKCLSPTGLQQKERWLLPSGATRINRGASEGTLFKWK